MGKRSGPYFSFIQLQPPTQSLYRNRHPNVDVPMEQYRTTTTTSPMLCRVDTQYLGSSAPI